MYPWRTMRADHFSPVGESWLKYFFSPISAEWARAAFTSFVFTQSLARWCLARCLFTSARTCFS